MTSSPSPRRAHAGFPPRVLVALLAAWGLALSACGSADPPAAAQFRLESLAGEVLGPEDYPGRVVVVDFWATWCQPCRAQATVLDTLHRELDGGEVQFLAVDLGEPEAMVRSFVERNPFPYPVLLDPESTLAAELGIDGLPTLLVIDRRGRVAYFEPGVVSAGELRGLLAELTG